MSRVAVSKNPEANLSTAALSAALCSAHAQSVHQLTNMEFPQTGLISNTWSLRQTRFPAFILYVCVHVLVICWLFVWVLQGRNFIYPPPVSLSLFRPGHR